jgi:hypothetical protein
MNAKRRLDEILKNAIKAGIMTDYEGTAIFTCVDSVSHTIDEKSICDFVLQYGTFNRDNIINLVK